MKLNEVFKPIFENVLENDDPEEVLEYIKANCGPYIDLNPDFIKSPLYRGVKRHINSPFVLRVPKARDPVDSSVYIQDGIDNVLEDRGFEARRGNSLFCTGDARFASDYGEIYEIFPIGDLDFTWSDKINDLIGSQSFIFTNFGLTANDGKKFKTGDRDYNKQLADEAGGINGDFGPVVDWIKYVNNENLPNAIRSGHEIMVRCDEALYVPKGYFE